MLVSAGVSREVLESASGIQYANLLDPDERVPLSLHVNLWAVASEALSTTNPAFALHLGAYISPEQSGIIGNIFMQSKSLAAASDQIARYVHLIAESDHWETQSVDGDTCKIIYTITEPDFHTVEAVERSLASAISWARCFLQQPDLSPTEVWFQHSPPSHIEDYKQLFKAPLRFNAPDNAILLPRSTYETENPNPNPYLFDVLQDKADALALELKTQSVQEQVKRLLNKHIADGAMTMGLIAEELNMSHKTLYRRLKEENTSFQQLIEEFRKSKAHDYLNQTALPVEEVAFLLGFSEASAFHRAFKRWFGKKPSEMRQKPS